MKRRSVVARGSVLMLSLALIGCGAEAVEVGELQPLPLQSAARFPVGSTYFLPDPVSGRWELESAPEGNANAVVAGNDGFSRFTPVVAGEYGFRIAGSEERRSLTAVSEVHKCTHLVLSRAAVVPKMLTALVLQKHVVAAAWLEAVLARKMASDAFPNEALYAPGLPEGSALPNAARLALFRGASFCFPSDRVWNQVSLLLLLLLMLLF